MSNDVKAVLVVCAAIVALSLVLVLGICAYLFQQYLEQREDFSEYRYPDDVAYSITDQVIEAGALSPEPDLFARLLERRIIVLTETINERSIRRMLRQLEILERADGHEPIDLLLASGGGWTDGAFAIVDRIHRMKTTVNVHAEGGCYSGCVVILTAATGLRSAGPNCLLSVHANRTDSEEAYSWPTLDLGRFDRHFKRFARLPERWFPLASDRSYYLSAEQALEFGIIDEIR